MAMMAGQQHFGTKQNIIRINSIRIPMTTSLWRMTHILMHRIGITHRKSIYPGAVPEFKTWKEKDNMTNWDHIDGVITNLTYDEEAMRFKTISEFKYCLSH